MSSVNPRPILVPRIKCEAIDGPGEDMVYGDTVSLQSTDASRWARALPKHLAVKPIRAQRQAGKSSKLKQEKTAERQSPITRGRKVPEESTAGAWRLFFCWFLLASISLQRSVGLGGRTCVSGD